MNPDPTPEDPIPEDSGPDVPPTTAPGRMRLILAGGAAVVATVVVLSQILLVLTTRSNSDDVAELQAQLINLEQQVAGMSGSADGIDLRVGAIEELLGAAMTQPSPETTTATTSPDPTTSITTAPGAVSLPRFTGNNLEDPALGLGVGTLTGIEYYRGTTAAYAPEPGVGRAIMVWAHWCEHCQAEIPVVADRVDDWIVMFRNVELVTVTTAIDDDRGNPLVPYLEEGRFPFPVLVDSDGALATQLGVSGYPFWVFLDPDGVVVGRWAGELGLERLEEILARLDELAAA